MTNLISENDTDVGDSKGVTSGVTVGASVGDVDAATAAIVDIRRAPLGCLIQHLTSRHHPLFTLIQHPAIEKSMR